jgi:hypothetical protein
MKAQEGAEVVGARDFLASGAGWGRSGVSIGRVKRGMVSGVPPVLGWFGPVVRAEGSALGGGV